MGIEGYFYVQTDESKCIYKFNCKNYAFFSLLNRAFANDGVRTPIVPRTRTLDNINLCHKILKDILLPTDKESRRHLHTKEGVVAQNQKEEWLAKNYSHKVKVDNYNFITHPDKWGFSYILPKEFRKIQKNSLVDKGFLSALCPIIDRMEKKNTNYLIIYYFYG